MAEITGRLRLKSSCMERGARRRSMPWMTPASGRVTAMLEMRREPLVPTASSRSSPERVAWDDTAGRTWKRSSV
jgi:hypothetical protein